MTGNEYQRNALRTLANTDVPYGTLIESAMGLSGESGECVDHIKKFLFQGHELDYNQLALEIGDCAWYLAMMAYAIGYGMDEIFEMNIEKLKKRYPDGFDVSKSVHREEYKNAES